MLRTTFRRCHAFLDVLPDPVSRTSPANEPVLGVSGSKLQQDPMLFLTGTSNEVRNARSNRLKLGMKAFFEKQRPRGLITMRMLDMISAMSEHASANLGVFHSFWQAIRSKPYPDAPTPRLLKCICPKQSIQGLATAPIGREVALIIPARPTESTNPCGAFFLVEIQMERWQAWQLCHAIDSALAPRSWVLRLLRV